MRSKTTIVALVAAAVFLTAGSTSSTSGAKDACSLLTPEQVSAALGITMQRSSAVSPHLCTWHGTGPDAGKKVALSMLTENGFAMGKTPVPGVDKPAVSGVGDEAYYKYYTEPQYEKIKTVDLDVKKGNAVFGISVAGFPLSDAKGMAKTLALEVLKNL